MKNLLSVVLPLLLLAACSTPQPTHYEYSQYQCGDKVLDVTSDPQADTVQFELDGIWYKLLRVDASDGAKYAFGDTSFWRQDKQAKVAQKEATLLTCQQK